MKAINIGLALILTILVADCAIFQTNQYYSMPVQPPKSNGNNNQGNYFWSPSTPGYTPPETTDQTQPVDDKSYFQPNIPANQAATDPQSPADEEKANRAKFADFKKNNGKYYTGPVEQYRYSVYVQNLKKIKEDNKNAVMHRQDLNQFADLTSQEFTAIYLTAQPAPVSVSATGPSTTATSGPVLSAVAPIDWRTSGKVNPIKNQGQCGSCWSFSVVGTIETNNALKRNIVPGTYSEQQLVDCCGARGYQCNGCNGGWTGSGFDYISIYGLTTSASYPYVAAQQVCRDNQVTFPKYLNTASSYTYLTGISNARALIKKGVVSVLVDATSWQFYTSGVLTCTSPVNLNHAVILVGVENDGTWIVRNSWSNGWGLSGYIRLNGNSLSSSDCGLSQYLLVPNLL